MSKEAPKPLTFEENVLIERMTAAQHAMQTGVLAEIMKDAQLFVENPLRHGCGPKHLRVGVNSALVEVSALATILMEKGVFTRTEYYQHMAEAYEAEQKLYEGRLGIKLK